MAANRREEPLEGHAIVQVLAGMDLEATSTPVLLERVEDRPPAPASSANASSTRPAGRCGQG